MNEADRSAGRPLGNSAAHRRWMLEIGRIRTRAAKARRGAPDNIAEVVDECLATSEALLWDLAGLEREGLLLQEQAQTERAAWDYLFQQIPIACLEVDGEGTILEANKAAGVLLNMSAQHLRERLLLHFAEDRVAFGGLLGRLDGQHAQTASLVLRPRERAACDVEATIVRRSPRDEGTWLWFLRAGPKHAAVRAEAAAMRAVSTPGEVEQA